MDESWKEDESPAYHQGRNINKFAMNHLSAIDPSCLLRSCDIDFTWDILMDLFV
jgi:hypothetical protein